MQALHRLEALRHETAALWRDVDTMVVPTAGTIYRIAEIEADPLRLNTNLGYYTNFVNLLDLAALAVPNGFQPDGLPSGITLIAPAWREPMLAAIGAAFQRQGGLSPGATGAPLPAARSAAVPPLHPYIPIAVVGAHLSGMALNGELVAAGGRLRAATRTKPIYRLYALPDGRRPGLVRVAPEGAAIEVEIWELPSAAFGPFVASIAPPLGIGTIELEDGGSVPGFLGEAYAAATARDITRHGGWRAFVTAEREGRG
jgi:allophanate hydrolase